MALSLALCAAALTRAHTASAQTAPPPSPAVLAEARTLFDQGITAADAGRYADAVTAFERSQSLRSSPVVLHNLAMAYRGVGRLQDAVSAFERYLQNPGPRATPANIAEMQRNLEAVRAEIPQLRFAVQPASATVQLDGRVIADRAVPLSLDPGRHVVEVNADDHRSFRVEFDLQRAERRLVEATLEQLPTDGRIAIDSNVANARIAVDDTFVGTQLASVTATPGEHTVVVTAPGYRPLRRTVQVGRHGVSRVTMVLQRTPGLPTWAIVSIVAGSVVAVAGITTVVAVIADDRTRDRFVPPVAPSLWGEIAFPQ